MNKACSAVALGLMAFLCACSGGRRADPLAGMNVGAPAKDLSVAYVYTENTAKSRAYLKNWKLLSPGFDREALFVRHLPEMLGRRFKSAAQADSAEKALASGSDVVAMIDVWAEHRGFGLGYVMMSVKIIFLTPGKQEIETIDVKKRKFINPLGATPVGPLIWGMAGNSLEKDVAAELEKRLQESAKLADYGRSRTVNPGAVAAAAPREYHSEVDVPEYKLAPNPDNFAVVVGVEKYSSLPEAQFAERDAQAVREHLIALGYPLRNIAFLTGAQATKTGLAKNLETWLPSKVSERSSVFFYYSGHGSPAVKTGQAYLVPVDGDPQYLEDTGYPLNRLYERLNALNAKQIVVAIDSCFSGAGGRSVLPKGTRPLVTQVDVASGGAGRVVSFAASDASQISGTDEAEGHGLFTYYFLRGLNGAAKGRDGKVTAKSLYDYLAPNVADEAKRANRDQTPMLTAPQPEQLVLRAE